MQTRRCEIKTVLCIGRWQPLHRGHIKLLTETIEEGNFLVIGIRDTRDADPENNPYSVEQRERMIKESLAEYNGQFAIITIPDYWCDLEVRVGRAVGYTVCRYENEIENISGKKLRDKLKIEGKL